MLAVCTNATHAAELANSSGVPYAVVVCSSPSSSFPTDSTNGVEFYGCSPNESCPATGRVWADCTAEPEQGDYHFERSEDVFGESDCSVPTVTIDSVGTYSLTNLTATSTAAAEVSVFGGSFTGNASMLWAYDDADVTNATPDGYFATEVATVPASCGYLACEPTGNNSVVPCQTLSPNPRQCIGNATLCTAVEGGYNLCLYAGCDWITNGSTYFSHPNNSYFFPPGCNPFTVCEQTTVPAIFPDDNTCLCLPGFVDDGLGNCTIEQFGTGVVCSETQYAQRGDNSTYKCVDLTTCDGEPLLEATETTDRVCASPPKVCVGFVDTETGICVEPKAQCSSVQIITGTNLDGTPKCINLSPPCPSHSFEKVAPTPTSDRVCVRYTGVNVYAATGFAVTPCVLYFAFMAYQYTR